MRSTHDEREPSAQPGPLRKTIRFTATEIERIARYAGAVRGMSEHGWLRQRILEPNRVAGLTVRLARLCREVERLDSPDPSVARDALARVRNDLHALYDEAAGG